MAKILRGLDMLAGEAGRVMYGENARKEQLLAGVQQRSQQDYLQGQKQQHQESMQDARMFNTMQNLQARLLQDKNQFSQTLDFKKTVHEDEMGLSRERLNALNRQTKHGELKSRRDKIAKEFKFFDEDLDRLSSQYNIISRKEDKTSEEKQIMSGIKTEMERIQYTKDQYWSQVVDPEFQNVIQEGQIKFDAIKQKRLDKIYGDFMRGLPGFGERSRHSFGNTSYSTPQGTDADKEINPLGEFE